MVNEERPDGAVHRGLHLGRLGLRLTGSYLGYQLQNLWFGDAGQAERRRRFHQKASHQVREELQLLKGPVMKLGQMLSMQGLVLPPEALEELSALQMHAPGMHPTLARAQFKSSLGCEPEAVFREFEPEPFAAASLGQVHRAVTQAGDTVAVKIQYPAIRKAVQNDFRLLRSAAVGGQFTGHVPKALLDEIETQIGLETDYVQEAKNLDRFQEDLRPLPFVHVPRVFHEFSTDRVLTMSYLNGAHLGDWLARKPPAALRSLVGSRLFELFYFQALRVCALHADPHPGNYLFSGEGEIGLVDFGCVKEVVPAYGELVRVFLDQDRLSQEEKVDRLARLIWGERPSRKQRGPRQAMMAALDLGRKICPPAHAKNAVVDFGDASLFAGLARIAKEVLQNKLTRPEWVFIKRAEIGLYNLLHLLGARVNTVEVLRRLQNA